MARMQMRFIDNVQMAWLQGLEPLFKQLLAHGRHYGCSLESAGADSALEGSSFICLTSHSDCRLTNSNSRAIRPNTSMMTQWHSVKSSATPTKRSWARRRVGSASDRMVI